MFCQNCGKEYLTDAKYCSGCGASLSVIRVPVSSNDNINPVSHQRELVVALILSIFFGNFGIDRFYLGYVGLGLLKVFTFGGCGVWWLIDIILIATRRLNDYDGVPLI